MAIHTPDTVTAAVLQARTCRVHQPQTQLQLHTLIPLLTAAVTASITPLHTLLLLLPCAILVLLPLPLLQGFKPLLYILLVLLWVLPALFCVAAAVLRPLRIHKHKLPQAGHDATANPSSVISFCPIAVLLLLLLLLQVLTHHPAAAVANASYTFQSVQQLRMPCRCAVPFIAAAAAQQRGRQRQQLQQRQLR
jgi:hypothetical protein